MRFASRCVTCCVALDESLCLSEPFWGSQTPSFVRQRMTRCWPLPRCWSVSMATWRMWLLSAGGKSAEVTRSHERSPHSQCALSSSLPALGGHWPSGRPLVCGCITPASAFASLGLGPPGVGARTETPQLSLSAPSPLPSGARALLCSLAAPRRHKGGVSPRPTVSGALGWWIKQPGGEGCREAWPYGHCVRSVWGVHQ